MFKGKVWLWIIVIACCFLVKGLFAWVPTWFDKYEVTLNSDISYDNSFNEVVRDSKTGKFKVQIREDADYFFTDKDFTKEGYTKYEDVLNSPIVMYMSNKLTNASEGFIRVSSNQYARKIDLYSILTAIENSNDDNIVEWEALGFNKKVINGPVELTIPNEQNVAYNKIVELFYLTLNNGNEVTDEIREELEPRVNNILSKCIKVVDIGQAVEYETKNRSKTNKAYIAPEYIFLRGGSSSFSTSNDYAYMPVYFMRTTFLNSDLYIKNENESDARKGNKTITFLDAIREDKHFFTATGWRVKEYEYELNKINSYMLREP